MMLRKLLEIDHGRSELNKKNVEPAAKKEFADVLNEWSTDDE